MGVVGKVPARIAQRIPLIRQQDCSCIENTRRFLLDCTHEPLVLSKHEQELRRMRGMQKEAKNAVPLELIQLVVLRLGQRPKLCRADRVFWELNLWITREPPPKLVVHELVLAAFMHGIEVLLLHLLPQVSKHRQLWLRWYQCIAPLLARQPTSLGGRWRVPTAG